MKLTRRQILAALGLAPLAFVTPAQAKPRKPRPQSTPTHLYPSTSLFLGRTLYPS